MPIVKNKRTALVVLLLLSGCAVGPQFQPPAAPSVAGYTPEPLVEKTIAAPVAVAGASQTFVNNKDVPAEWWTLFESEPLNALMQRALSANPTVKAAEATLREAEEALRAAKGAYLPQIDANLGVTREKINGAVAGSPGLSASPFTLYNTSVSVSYNPDIFGGTGHAVEAAAAAIDVQQFLLKATYLTLEANIVTAAVQEASLREQIKTTQDIIEIQSHQLRVLKHQLELGGVAKSAVLAQQATLAQTEALLPPLQKQLSQTRNQLKVLAGNFPSEKMEDSFDLATLHLPQELPVSLPSRLVEQRPDILAAEASLHIASAGVGIAAANMMPQITLTGTYGYAVSDLGGIFSPSAVIWNVGAGLLQPIFHGGELTHKHEAAIAAYDAAAAQYRGTVLSAFQNVSDALGALQFDAAALKADTAAEQAAAGSFHLSQKQFDTGAISYLALLNAESIYQQTRISLVTAEAARYADTAALFVALGGGWWNHPDNRRNHLEVK